MTDDLPVHVLPVDTFVATYRPASYDPPWSWHDELLDLLGREHEPFIALCRSVARSGIHEPVEVFNQSPLGDPAMADGHHRVLAAWLTGRAVPHMVLPDVC